MLVAETPVMMIASVSAAKRKRLLFFAQKGAGHRELTLPLGADPTHQNQNMRLANIVLALLASTDAFVVPTTPMTSVSSSRTSRLVCQFANPFAAKDAPVAAATKGGGKPLRKFPKKANAALDGPLALLFLLSAPGAAALITAYSVYISPPDALPFSFLVRRWVSTTRP